MKIYIDIDGVLINKNQQVPEYGGEFIHFITANFDCYWLTTHCRGDVNNAIEYLSGFYPVPVVERLKKIKKTDWTDLKTEAINLNEPFLWLEDYPFETEKRVLSACGRIDSLIIVDLKNDNELRRIRNIIENN